MWKNELHLKKEFLVVVIGFFEEYPSLRLFRLKAGERISIFLNPV